MGVMMTESALCWAGAVLAAGLAGYLRVREERSGVRRLLVGILLALAVESGLAGALVWGGDSTVWLRGRLTVLALLPGVLLPFSVGYARGDAAATWRRWRGAWWGAAAVAALLIGWLWTQPRLGEGEWWLGWPGVAIHLYVMAAAVLALANFEHTLRGAMGVMRWRVKYMVIGMGALLVTRLYTGSREVLLGQAEARLLTVNALALAIAAALVLLASRRSKLGAVDLYLSQHVLYRSVTLIVAGAYLVVMGGLTRLAFQLGIEESLLLRALLALAAVVGFVVLLLSDRLRQSVKRLVSRHFRRPEHDYRQVWTRFARQTESILDVPTLCRSAVRLVSETFEALSVSIWTAEPAASRLQLGASTTLSAARARELTRPDADDAEVLAGLEGAAEPFLVGRDAPAWARTLQVRNPDSFPKGALVCVPLKTRGQLLGVMTVGDRVSGREYSIEDFDLLGTIGDQLAANLYTVRLAGQLLEAREFEAFQTMSAFFVHDLKNTTSTLALMLQNLPAHFEDPAFREDALRSMRKAVDKMKDLIRRLSVLRRSLELDLRPANPAELVRQAVAALAASLPAPPRLDLAPVPDIHCDPEQVRTVLTNLVLNARDAIGPDGEIAIETAPAPGGAVIRVRDTGPGMSEEFIATSLFKPFRSTKKEGMGIGLFHSRMIVEAHRGSLRVDSRPGHGTTFHVTLPIHPGEPAP